MDHDDKLREHLGRMLDWHDAHADFDAAIDGLSLGAAGEIPHGFPHSVWQIVEHLRLTQRDILDFCRDPTYKEPNWPRDYWPRASAPASLEEWRKSIDAFRKDREDMQNLIADPSLDLMSAVPNGHGQTFLREALLLADHTAYHLGQLIAVRRLIGTWKRGHRG